MQPNIDIGAVLRRGYELYKDNITTLLVATLLAGILTMFTLGILAGPMMAGLAMITLGLIDKKQPKPEIGDLFKGFNFFVPSLLFFIAFFAAMMIGSVILGIIPILGLILPTLYQLALGTFAMFVIYNIVDRKMEIVPAIQASVDTVKANFWIFLALYIVASVVSMIGLVACGVGVILTAPMCGCMLAITYRDLHPAGQADATQAG